MTLTSFICSTGEESLLYFDKSLLIINIPYETNEMICDRSTEYGSLGRITLLASERETMRLSLE